VPIGLCSPRVDTRGRPRKLRGTHSVKRRQASFQNPEIRRFPPLLAVDGIEHLARRKVDNQQPMLVVVQFERALATGVRGDNDLHFP
jgi:hypothetical protein